jgi:uncharacterized protein (TIGR02996 family)
MDDETTFLRYILAAPEAESLRLVFADWLEEQGRCLRPPKGNVQASCGHKYPKLHRVGDIRLRGEPYRVVRCIECNGKLEAIKIENSYWRAEPGVPIWLEGIALQRWIEDELADEAGERIMDRPTDWERYRQ